MKRSDYPLLCAHRGLSAACPENTLPALASAAAVGAHEVEFDLWLSADGVPVVCHDPSVDRTTDGSGEISAMEWKDIKTLDAGVKRGDRWRGLKIPRLEEALHACGKEVVLNIHVKDAGAGGKLVRLLCDILRESGLSASAYIAAASEEALSESLEYAPEIERAVLFGKDRPQGQIKTALKFKSARVQFGKNAGEDDFLAAREAGLTSNLFYSDAAEEAMEYSRKGVDVVLTNCAHRLIAEGIPGRL